MLTSHEQFPKSPCFMQIGFYIVCPYNITIFLFFYFSIFLLIPLFFLLISLFSIFLFSHNNIIAISYLYFSTRACGCAPIRIIARFYIFALREYTYFVSYYSLSVVERLGLWVCRESWAHKRLFNLPPQFSRLGIRGPGSCLSLFVSFMVYMCFVWGTWLVLGFFLFFRVNLF